MGIFDGHIYDYYHVELQFKALLLGGIPKDPRVMQAWLRKRTGIVEDDTIQKLALRTLRDLGVEIGGVLMDEDMDKALDRVAEEKHTKGFKRHPQVGVYIESRQVAAMLKEAVAIRYPYKRGSAEYGGWGPTAKTPQAFWVEHAFVEPYNIPVGIPAPDNIMLLLGHVSGAGGRRSTLTYVEICRQPRISFDLKITKDSIKAEWLERIWEQAQDDGLGADRSQQYGKFDVEVFDKVDRAHMASCSGSVPVVSLGYNDDEIALALDSLPPASA